MAIFWGAGGGHKSENIFPTGIMNASHGPAVSHSCEGKIMFLKSCQRGLHGKALNLNIKKMKVSLR